MVESLAGTFFYLDSNPLIYALEGGTPWTEQLRHLFASFDRGELAAASSEITLSEVLIKPFEHGAVDLVARYEAIFSDTSPLVVRQVDRPIIVAAAHFRAGRSIKLVDAIHVATASALSCSHFLSNDARLLKSLTAGMVGVLPADLPRS
jgi:predicted nucleic acid-binding protein